MRILIQLVKIDLVIILVYSIYDSGLRAGRAVTQGVRRVVAMRVGTKLTVHIAVDVTWKPVLTFP